MLELLAETIDTQTYKSNVGNILFTALFFLALIILGIWWLKRQV